MTTRTVVPYGWGMMENKPWLSVTAAECKWDYFRVGGNGGQKVNKTSSGVRVTHPPSGAVGKSTDTRSQSQNRRIAWRRMADDPKFRAWIRTQGGRQAKIEAEVDRLMQDRYIRTEVKQDGLWAVTDVKDLTDG